MADKKKGGRYTPKRRATPSEGPSDAGRPKRSDPDEIVQVGRRPSSPGFLFGVAAMWIVAGILIGLFFTAGWKLIPAIFAVGIGLFFLRGALQTVIRQDDQLHDDHGD